ncbi:MAG: tetratricopeptide repeat protein [Crocosphaera sp.]|nr:tetratricopeptide repeat protein [Crocosphaera sp.]
MTNFTPLEAALTRYKIALDNLDTSNRSVNQEQILDLLAARDELQKQLESEGKIPVEIWSKLIEQDNKLKQNSYKITGVVDLEEYRDALPISTKAWWWYLDSRESQHPCNRFDWVFKIVKLLLLGVNFTLIATIATRFLAGGSGWQEIAVVIFSTFISLLQTENALTKGREKVFIKLMNKVNIKEHWYEEVQLFTTFIIFVGLLIITLNFPCFSEFYKQQGEALQSPENSQELPQLASAEGKYVKAIEFNPDNLDAHYKLATLYEELQELDKAKKHYLIAVKGDFLDAYNNLSYIYIRENKAPQAVELLEKAKVLLAEREQTLDQLTENEKLNLQVQKYSIYKNLGWARFKQNRNEDAMINLLIAKSIAENKAYQKYIRNPGAVFCLYAQVLPEEAQENWRKCWELSQGKELTIEEEQWVYEARKKLKLK